MVETFPMIITQIYVKNFGCILDEKLDCEPLTALVGPNGSGKSTFLRALELFYAASPKVTIDDFYNRDSSEPIEIAVTFSGLGPEPSKRFARYLDKGNLTVVRVLSLEDGKLTAKLHGSRLQNAEFRPTREAGNKTEAKRLYGEFRQRAEYTDLPTAASAEAALTALEEWEQKHPESLSWQRDQGQFFGFKEVGQGYLGEFTHLILIPAVREASDEGIEGKGSAITELMDLVVRSTLASSEELKKFTEDARKRYDKVMAGETTQRQLMELEKAVGATLRTYVPTASVTIRWVTEGAITVSLPRADVRLLEDAYPSPVDRTGHGLQRAFILAMLQHLASARTAPVAKADEEGGIGTGIEATETAAPGDVTPLVRPNLVVAIEEPELYQHPSRQRHLANVLLKLSSGSIPGVADTTQVIYATHSPLFVGIDRFDQTRLIRKVVNGDGKPRIARVTRTDMNAVAAALWEACGRKDRNGKDVAMYTGDSLRPRLQCLMTPWMSESFFADVVVLVEGEGDRAAILGAALAEGHDFESLGIAVIPCGGKPSVDRPALIFKGLGIPTYLVWDGDQHDEDGIRTNHILQRIVGVEPVDCPSGPNARFACFQTKLENTLGEELAPEYATGLENCREEFGYAERKQAEKNPRVMAEVIRRAAAKGKKSASLEAIVGHILALHKCGAATHVRRGFDDKYTGPARALVLAQQAGVDCTRVLEDS